MAGLVPAIHVSFLRGRVKTWMPATSAGMTERVSPASLHSELLVGAIDEFVGVGLRQVDIRLGDLRRRLAEDGQHRLRALRVHAAGRRIHGNRVLERPEINALL